MSHAESKGRYFNFPLSVLQYAPLDRHLTNKAIVVKRLELALNVGMYNAGKGYLQSHGEDEFDIFVDRLRRDHELTDDDLSEEDNEQGYFSDPFGDEALALVGAAICNVSLGSYSVDHLRRIANDGRKWQKPGPFVRMKSAFFWAALNQARAEADEGQPWPERGISWREFRVLAAILSVRTNKAGFAFIGWETISARASGFTKKVDFESSQRARNIAKPRNLPPLSRKVIRKTCDMLENLEFFARFHFSSSKVGGRTAYSFRHDRDELAKAVCDGVNFRDLAKIRENRAADAAACRELLIRAKSGNKPRPSDGPCQGPSREPSPGPT